jgi:hypothetical protein
MIIKGYKNLKNVKILNNLNLFRRMSFKHFGSRILRRRYNMPYLIEQRNF